MIRRATLILLAAALLLPGWARAGELVPHRAVYSMRLVKSEDIGAISNARGAMVYEFRDTCDGWATDSRVYLRLALGGGPEVENVRTMSTWESKDGEGFRFRLSERQGNESETEITGVAISGPDGGVVEYSAPREFAVDLPKGTLFPTAHLRAMIAAAEEGTAHLGRTLFDGATLKNPYLVSAVISPAIEAPPKVMGNPAMMADVDWWSARLAYFPARGEGDTPEFELGVSFGADGVVRVINQDFGDYVIRATLNELESLPPVTCEPDGAPGNR